MSAPLDPQPIAMDWEEADDIGIRWAVFPAGCLVPQHSHTYDHVSAIPYGKVKVTADGQLLGEYTGPCCILIKANTKHLFEVIEKTMLMCIHNISRSGKIEVAEEHHIAEVS